jgi:hypothetical protein
MLTLFLQLEAEVIEKGMRIREITENNGLLLETMKQLQTQNVEVSASAYASDSTTDYPANSSSHRVLATCQATRNSRWIRQELR